MYRRLVAGSFGRISSVGPFGRAMRPTYDVAVRMASPSGVYVTLIRSPPRSVPPLISSRRYVRACSDSEIGGVDSYSVMTCVSLRGGCGSAAPG